MRISKVYTRTGDAGKTRLAGGQEIWKDAVRVETYGTVDELNSVIGLVRVFHSESVQDRLQHPISPHRIDLEQELRWIQNKLFDVGSLLATAPGVTLRNTPCVTHEHVERLERMIDTCQADLAPLKEFILPGGGKISGFLHQARAVCRRAERLCVTLMREEEVAPEILKFLNRLSDALFVLARWVAKMHGEPEFLWERDLAPRSSSGE
ncbi:MAG: cob(I)yrinic acid a,c-diamide adenosyltransferase [Nitrospirae bacterium]|nr:MAG: cob(I)yrinic acid a,c-diamide adenosyltransferase [Nitrospirota bacterium]